MFESLIPGASRPWVIAHRGASAERPENTLIGFDHALSGGSRYPIDAIELDVQLSSDGEIMVYHDRTLKKLGLPRRRVAGLSADALSRLDVGGWFDSIYAGTAMPTLRQVLARYGGKVPLLLEVKERGGARSARQHRRLMSATCAMVQQMGLAEHCLILSFGLPLLHHGMSEFSTLRYAWNLKAPPVITPQLKRDVAPLFALCCKVTSLNRGFVDWTHDQGKAALSYTVNTPKQVDHARAAGVDGLITDHPHRLAEHLGGAIQ